MKYQISMRHVELFNQLFDYTLKSVGLNGVSAVSNLITLINASNPNPISTIELDENQIKVLNSMSDIILKSQGLIVLGLVMELSGFLSNPLQEETSKQEEEK